MYGGLQCRACISEALGPEVIASRKTIFQVRYFRWQFRMGSNGASLMAARTNSRHQVGSIIRGMPLVCSRPLIHLHMEGSRLRDAHRTMAYICEIAVTYISLEGVHQQCVGLELQEVQDKLHSYANGILTPPATPDSETLPPAIVHPSRGVAVGSEDCSDSCIRKALALEVTPLSFHAGNWRVSRLV